MTKFSSDKVTRRFGCGLALGIFLGIGMFTILMVGSVFANNEIHQQSYNEAQDNVTSAVIKINIGVGRLEITSLADTSDLFYGDISYIGELDYRVSGSETKQISLNQTQNNYGFDSLFNLLNINPINNQDALLWVVNLSPDVPLELDIESGVGDFELDLSGLQIADLRLKTGVGQTTVTLAQPTLSYDVMITSGVGDTTLILPEGAAVRVEAEIGLGNSQFPTGLQRISIDDDDTEIWETDNFNAADEQIIISLTDGVGNLTVQ